MSRPKLHSQYQSLEEMSATAQDFEAAYVVDLVEEMPIKFKSAMESNDAAKWKEACSLEMDSLHKTWTLVLVPKRRNAIDNRWVYCVKDF